MLKRTPFKSKSKKAHTKAESAHMGRVAQLGCMVCLRLHGPHEPGPVELHHPRRGIGMGQRASHNNVIPLCIEHHRGDTGIHGYGTKGFTDVYHFDEADLLADVRQLLGD